MPIKFNSTALSLLAVFYLLSFLSFTASAHRHIQVHTSPGGLLPSKHWYQRDDHPVHKLFSRDAVNSRRAFAEVGSPSWSAAYPVSTPDRSLTPAAWTAALQAAVAANKIPNIPIPDANLVYPNGANPTSPEICSATLKCPAPGDVWNGPDGSIGIGFDDGPVAAASPQLYDFLKANRQKATHFMIGVAILQAPAVFLQAYNNGDDIAVHTYTHPHMTTLANEDILAQLGWSMQIIYDSTQGRLPKFWRPPYGDMDNRVRAIASEVFGLTPIVWNRDSADWSIGAPNGATNVTVAGNLTSWITGPKAPGLIILEHELNNMTVQAFIDAYPAMKSNGWKLGSVAEMVASSVDNVTGKVYWNAPNGNGGKPSSAGLTDHGEIGKVPVASGGVLASSTIASQTNAGPVSNSGSVSPTSGAPSIPISSSPSATSPAPSQPTQSSNADNLNSPALFLAVSLFCWTLLPF